jgi:hypothetical protein
MSHEFRLNDTAYWFQVRRSGILLSEGRIYSINSSYVKLRRRTIFVIGVGYEVYHSDLFPTKEAAINSMIARLEKLRDE